MNARLHTLPAAMTALLRQGLRTLWCMLVLLALHSGAARAGDLVIERAWLEDKTGTMGWQEAMQSTEWRTETRHTVINRGYGSSPVWYRLRIDPSRSGLPPEAKLKMRIRPAYLDALTLFDPLQTPAQQPTIGDHQIRSESAELGPFWGYDLPAGHGSRDVWVRLQTTSTRMAHIEVMDETAMQRSNVRIEHFGALYLSVLFVFIAWGGFQLLFQRDRLSLLFVAYQISALLFGLCLLGYANLYASPWWAPRTIDLFMNVTGVGSTYVVFLFSNQLMSVLRAYPWRRVLNGVLHLLFLVCFGLIAGGHVRTALQINMSVIFFLPILHWLIAVFTPIDRSSSEKEKLPKAGVIAYFTISLVIALLASMPALNLVPATEISHYVVSLYSVCSGLMMMMILQYRSIQNIKEHSQLTAQTEQAHRQARQERAFRQETEKLLAMLGHELKTPLSTLMLQVNNPMIPQPLARGLGSAIMDMNHVIERTIQVDHLERKKHPILTSDCDFPQWLHSLIASQAESDRVQTHISPLPHPTLRTDTHLLTIMVRNLLDNALKYSPEGSLVSAQLRQLVHPAEWQLTISNLPGRAGWPESDKVFEKYYRNPAASYRSGTGLGLFLIKSLADQLGYRIEYRPNAHSVVFHLVIPIQTPASGPHPS